MEKKNDKKAFEKGLFLCIFLHKLFFMEKVFLYNIYNTIFMYCHVKKCLKAL